MSVNVEDKIKRLGAAQREKVEARAAELITEEIRIYAAHVSSFWLRLEFPFAARVSLALAVPLHDSKTLVRARTQLHRGHSRHTKP